MPDWDEINKRKRKEINLGMAKNGAVQILKDTKNVHWLKLYKETVRLLFSFNEELDKEILEMSEIAIRKLPVSTQSKKAISEHAQKSPIFDRKIGNKILTKGLEAVT